MVSRVDWSSLERKGLAEYIWSLAPKIINQPLSVDQFHGMIYRRLKKHLPLRITKTRYDKVEPNTVFVGGCYYSIWDQKNKNCIELSLFYNPVDKQLKINARKFQRICIVIADTILHEVIHMRQFRRRDFKDLPDYPSTARRASKREEQSYLGNSDEIDAYGFNIACDLMDRYQQNTKDVVKHLNLDQRAKRLKCDEWYMYLKAFDHDHDHAVIKKVKKKVLQYLPNAILGKPYRDRYWINQ